MAAFFRKHKFKFYVLALFLILSEIIAFNIFRQDHYLQMARKFLKDDQNPIAQPRLTGTPYLNYTCTPDYNRAGMEDGHNASGFRGKAISLIKEKKEYRILFLGGSTTYSYFIEHADSTLPEQVKSIVNDSKPWTTLMRDSGMSLQVVNAGLPAATSAELLTHYLFKYRYYKPDLVVIHTGGNDSYAYYLGSHYQPDYSHYRNSFPKVTGVPFYLRPLLLSRSMSLLIIRVFYSHLLTEELYEHVEDWPIANWFDQDDFMKNEEHNAFYKNIETLVNTIRLDGSEVMLVPFIYNKEWPGLAKVYLDGVDNNVGLLKSLSDSLNISYCQLSPEMIPYPNGWMDDCHLTPTGINIKAIAISKEVEKVLAESFKHK
ncbi:MAG TPA: hypothetical protein DCR04_08355 [Flavobacteriales bacterium]|nr:hypothetical protein [Flavobacteriales bacterium]